MFVFFKNSLKQIFFGVCLNLKMFIDFFTQKRANNIVCPNFCNSKIFSLPSHNNFQSVELLEISCLFQDRVIHHCCRFHHMQHMLLILALLHLVSIFLNAFCTSFSYFVSQTKKYHNFLKIILNVHFFSGARQSLGQLLFCKIHIQQKVVYILLKKKKKTKPSAGLSRVRDVGDANFIF